MILNLKQHTCAVTSLNLFSDDSHVVSGSRDRNIYMCAHGGGLHDLCITTRMMLMIKDVATQSLVLHITHRWDLTNETRAVSLMQRMGGINAAALLSDHASLVTVGQEKSTTYWDLRESDPVKQIAMGVEQLCTAVFPGLSAEGQVDEKTVFATGGNDGVVRLWNHKQAAVIAEGRAHSGPVRDLKFAPDGRQLVSVGDDGAVLVWNIFADEHVQEDAPAVQSDA